MRQKIRLICLPHWSEEHRYILQVGLSQKKKKREGWKDKETDLFCPRTPEACGCRYWNQFLHNGPSPGVPSGVEEYGSGPAGLRLATMKPLQVFCCGPATEWTLRANAQPHVGAGSGKSLPGPHPATCPDREFGRVA